jgi:hypothetical protein
MRLSPNHKRALHVAFLGLWCSGVLWLLFHYFLQQPGDFGPRPHPLEHWWLRLHGLAVFAMLIALGSLIPAHGPLAWRVRRQRVSGLAMFFLAAWLVGTGYALYYLVGERDASWLPVLHWGAGLSAPLWALLHRRRHARAVAGAGREIRA